MKIIAEKMMASQIKIASGTNFYFKSLCFEADELGELTRRVDKEDSPGSNSVTTGASSIGSVFEARHDYDYNSPM